LYIAQVYRNMKQRLIVEETVSFVWNHLQIW
jgi:hypothetical protein